MEFEEFEIDIYPNIIVACFKEKTYVYDILNYWRHMHL